MQGRANKKQRSILIPIIVSNIESHFKNLKNCKEFDVFKLLDVVKWSYGQDKELLTELHHNHTDVISERFNSVLSYHKFNAKEVKKEWKKVTYCFCFVFLFCFVCVKSDQSNYCMNHKDSISIRAKRSFTFNFPMKSMPYCLTL